MILIGMIGMVSSLGILSSAIQNIAECRRYDSDGTYSGCRSEEPIISILCMDLPQSTNRFLGVGLGGMFPY